ncbi:MAG TPA: DUF4129 domain-containing protein [Pilimelia sp.]|nr:DUF4129 domain-containing protein [Pilimelia sp.]
MNPPVWRSWWPLAAVVLLLALVAAAAAQSTPQLDRLDGTTAPAAESPPREPVQESEQALPPGPVDPSTGSDWLLALAAGLGLALLIAVVVAGLVIAIRDQLRRRPGGGAADPVPGSRTAASDDVVAALDAGLVELDDADGDPRRAVIACWVRLERAAAAAGTPRHIADTPTDLVTRLLAGHSVSATVLAGFAAVYREARYATHTVDDDMRAQARAALRRLRGELTGSGTGAVVAGAGPARGGSVGRGAGVGPAGGGSVGGGA